MVMPMRSRPASPAPPAVRSTGARRAAGAAPAGPVLPVLASAPAGPDRPVPAPRGRRRQAERSAATRAQLLDATAELVRSGGIRKASMFEVAKAAGVTPGALQHHFGSKAELMAQVVERLLAADDAHGIAWPSPGLPLPRRARAFVQTLWTGVYQPPRFLAAWGIYFGSAGEPVLRERIAAQRRRVAGGLTRRFTQVFPELAGRPGTPAFVTLVLAGLRGLAVQHLFDDSSASTAAARRELAALIESRCREASAAAPGPSSPRRSSQP